MDHMIAADHQAHTKRRTHDETRNAPTKDSWNPPTSHPHYLSLQQLVAVPPTHHRKRKETHIHTIRIHTICKRPKERNPRPRTLTQARIAHLRAGRGNPSVATTLGQLRVGKSTRQAARAAAPPRTHVREKYGHSRGTPQPPVSGVWLYCTTVLQDGEKDVRQPQQHEQHRRCHLWASRPS